MDEDLEILSREDLIAEVKKLRDGIRKHRDTEMHDLCWHQPELWGLLPEKTDPLPRCLSGRSFYSVVCATGNRWMFKFHTRQGRMSRLCLRS